MLRTRRVAIPVVGESMEQSIRFYETIFGMRVVRDSVLRSDGNSILGLPGLRTMRAVFMQKGESTVGMLALLEYQDPPLDVRRFEKRAGLPFPVVFVFAAESVAEMNERVQALGAPIVGRPRVWEIPGKGIAKGMTFLDPNGVLCELTEFPVPEIPPGSRVSPIRRVTIPIAAGKMAESVRFYEQVVGMRVFYDAQIKNEAAETELGVGPFTIHLVSMQQDDGPVGMIGLLEYLDPPMDVRPFERLPGAPYPLIFVVAVDDKERALDRAAELGAPVIGRHTEYRTAEGDVIHAGSCLDPNGVLLELSSLA